MNNQLEATAARLGKSLTYLSGTVLAESADQHLDAELVDAAIADACARVQSPRLRTALDQLLRTGTAAEKEALLLQSETVQLTAPAGEMSTEGQVCEVVCFTVCFHSGAGGITHPGGPDDLSDKCYQRCKDVCA